MSHQDHPLAALHAAVDGRLDAAERAALDRHLETCEACRREFEVQSRLKRAVTALPAPDVPADLAARIAAGIQLIDREQAASTEVPATSPRAVSRGWWPFALAAAAAVLIIGIALQWRATPAGWPESAASSVRAYGSGTLPLTLTSGDAEVLSRELRSQVGFPVRVFDLGMMGYSMAGGRVHAIAERVSALWVYRGADGTLLCQMFRGLVSELPPPEETREQNGITFYIYHAGGGTQVFWQEGDIVCVLASNLPAGTVIDLAIAKAMKP